MLSKIQTTLADAHKQFDDTRINHCKLLVSSLENDRYMLTGSVLDVGTLTAVTTHLKAHFPTITVDTASINILRKATPNWATVATNVAGLHRVPTRSQEMVSQLLNGWQVESLMEEGGWVYIRQPDGYLGWVQANYLTKATSPIPTHMVTKPIALLRTKPDVTATLAGRVMMGTAVTVTQTNGKWAALKLADGIIGWTLCDNLDTIDRLANDISNRRQIMIRAATQLIGVPYRWGGITPLGIDCSGLAQLVHRLVGVTIPRDADMEYLAGAAVEPPFQAGDLLFFGSDQGHRSISHVGISMGGWKMIHSSGSRNGVFIDDVEAVPALHDIFQGARTFL